MFSCKNKYQSAVSSLDAAPQILRAKGEIHPAMSLLDLFMLAVAERTDDSLIGCPDLQFSTAKLRIRLLGNRNSVSLSDEAIPPQNAALLLQFD